MTVLTPWHRQRASAKNCAGAAAAISRIHRGSARGATHQWSATRTLSATKLAAQTHQLMQVLRVSAAHRGARTLVARISPRPRLSVPDATRATSATLAPTGTTSVWVCARSFDRDRSELASQRALLAVTQLHVGAAVQLDRVGAGCVGGGMPRRWYLLRCSFGCRRARVFDTQTTRAVKTPTKKSASV